MLNISDLAAINPFAATGYAQKKTLASVVGNASDTITPSAATKELQDMVMSRFLDVTNNVNSTLADLFSSASSSSADPFAISSPTGNATGSAGIGSTSTDADLALLNFNQMPTSVTSLAESLKALLAITNNNPSAMKSYLTRMLQPTDLFGGANTQQSFAGDINSIFQPSGSIIDQFL
jgi:hypothetical protein